MDSRERWDMDWRQKAVERIVRDGMSVSRAAKESGRSRRTVYRWLCRYRDEGLLGLRTRKPVPKADPRRVDGVLVQSVLETRLNFMCFGPKKLLVRLERDFPGWKLPSVSWIAGFLRKAGLTRAKGRGRKPVRVAVAGSLVTASEPNQLWTMDFKGHWRTRDGRRCMPLTVQDAASRYVLLARVLERADGDGVIDALCGLFQEHGKPEGMRFDNGAPFACTSAVLGLSRLGAWLVMQGIRVERMAPSHPDQNARHERMHGDMARMVEAGRHSLEEEAGRLEHWRHRYNFERPHESLGMLMPGEVYRRSDRKWHGEVVEWRYPAGFDTRMVRPNGAIKLDGLEIRLGTAFRGYRVGLELVEGASGAPGGTQVAVADGTQAVCSSGVGVTPGSGKGNELGLASGQSLRVWFCGLLLGTVLNGRWERADLPPGGQEAASRRRPPHKRPRDYTSVRSRLRSLLAAKGREERGAEERGAEERGAEERGTEERGTEERGA